MKTPRRHRQGHKGLNIRGFHLGPYPPAKQIDYNVGRLCLKNGLLLGVVACYFGKTPLQIKEPCLGNVFGEIWEWPAPLALNAAESHRHQSSLVEVADLLNTEVEGP